MRLLHAASPFTTALPDGKLQAVLRGWARAEEAAVLLVDGNVVDAGLAAAHQPVRVELPQFVAIGPPPLPRRVVGLVLESDGDAVLPERPEVLAQRVIEFALPFPGKELDDLVPSGDEAVAIAPHRIDGIGGGDALGIAGVPRVLGGLHLPQRGLEGKRGQRWAIGHGGLLTAALAEYLVSFQHEPRRVHDRLASLVGTAGFA